jgi:hypothetical protein
MADRFLKIGTHFVKLGEQPRIFWTATMGSIFLAGAAVVFADGFHIGEWREAILFPLVFAGLEMRRTGK